ncbi:hypothetical protein FISHEDRAFT_68440 [Fistulina hepatica ATCC 64428]|uniref:Uncharacterized protein n=1 Tax=Fistulina hepatica ATCC 64428 TaxID=1128425 RepID=A0A0D7ARB6_9AGAR|nr:hypothetical protein FISHEDRAFT_68440 [Fistulina hepatica ATCC 64428]
MSAWMMDVDPPAAAVVHKHRRIPGAELGVSPSLQSAHDEIFAMVSSGTDADWEGILFPTANVAPPDFGEATIMQRHVVHSGERSTSSDDGEHFDAAVESVGGKEDRIADVDHGIAETDGTRSAGHSHSSRTFETDLEDKGQVERHNATYWATQDAWLWHYAHIDATAFDHIFLEEYYDSLGPWDLAQAVKELNSASNNNFAAGSALSQRQHLWLRRFAKELLGASTYLSFLAMAPQIREVGKRGRKLRTVLAWIAQVHFRDVFSSPCDIVRLSELLGALWRKRLEQKGGLVDMHEVKPEIVESLDKAVSRTALSVADEAAKRSKSNFERYVCRTFAMKLLRIHEKYSPLVGVIMTRSWRSYAVEIDLEVN